MSARRVAIVSAAYTPKPGSSRVRQTFKEMIVESAYQALNAIKMHPPVNSRQLPMATTVKAFLNTEAWARPFPMPWVSALPPRS